MNSSKYVVLFGANYEMEHWVKAFDNHNLTPIYCDLQNYYDLGIKYKEEAQELFVTGESKALWNPLAGIWRIGAVNPPWTFTPFLELLDAASGIFPMINSAASHLLCARRLSMYSRLQRVPSLPIVNLQGCITGRYLVEGSFRPSFPLVLKLGNFQGGLMKWKIDNEQQLADFMDSFQAFDMPVIIEDYVVFHSEYRSLFVGEDIYLIRRKDIQGWKAQHSKKLEIIPVDDEVREMTIRAKEAIGLDIGALDFVEGEGGYTIFEVNDAPDINAAHLGIDDNLFEKVANLLVSSARR